MGTESEALRWKQWIDRWIKISAPEISTPSIASSVSSSKIDSTSNAGHRKSLLTTEQLRYQLINMVKVKERTLKSFDFSNHFNSRKVIQFSVKVFAESCLIMFPTLDWPLNV